MLKELTHFNSNYFNSYIELTLIKSAFLFFSLIYKV